MEISSNFIVNWTGGEKKSLCLNCLWLSKVESFVEVYTAQLSTPVFHFALTGKGGFHE